MTHYIHGFHAGSRNDGYGSTGAQNMEDRPGWIVFTEIAGIDGGDYSLYKSKGFGVIVRLNHGYHPNGTIPERHSYPEFAVACAMHVKNSKGVDVWIIGNEPNHSQERPNGVPISSKDYADCFRACRDTIKSYTPAAQVVVAAVAPYNNETGDFGDYQVDVLHLLNGAYDGVAVHAYTHGPDPALITSPQHMGPPFEAYHYNFRVYRDLLARIPPDVPIYLTETNQDDPWLDVNWGWVQEMYREVDAWNTDNPRQVIRCACLYRYPTFDQWYIAGKGAVVEDFRQAVDIGYTWTEREPEPPEPEPPDPPEEDDMKVIFTSKMDDGFYRYDGIGPLTVPVGSVPLWEHDGHPDSDLPRPEYAERTPPHTHQGSPYAAGIFTMHATQEGALVWRIDGVEPGKPVKASCWTMGDEDQNAQMGMQLGIALHDPGEGAIEVVTAPDGRATGELYSRVDVWSAWHNGKPNNEWVELHTPEAIAEGYTVWIVMLARADYKLPSHMHFDDLVVMAETDVDPPDPGPHPPTECNALTAAQVRAIVREELDRTRLTGITA
jgi:hypothetical protein